MNSVLQPFLGDSGPGEFCLCSEVREVSWKNSGTGFVKAPFASSEFRNFKREIEGLLKDPIGTAEQLDGFLGPNIFN